MHLVHLLNNGFLTKKLILLLFFKFFLFNRFSFKKILSKLIFNKLYGRRFIISSLLISSLKSEKKFNSEEKQKTLFLLL